MTYKRLITALVLPSLLDGTGADPNVVARRIGGLSLYVVGIPAFLVGLLVDRYLRRREAKDTHKFERPSSLLK